MDYSNTNEVNSHDYWEQRFAEDDWKKNGGGSQSEFFARVAYDVFPEFLKADLLANEWTAVDIGCAEGEGTAYFAERFPKCHFIGQDFSESAVESAKKAFPICSYEVKNVYDELTRADVVLSSNTLEHLTEPEDIMRRMCEAASKYAVLILPFEDDMGIAEHINRFDCKAFPIQLADSYLSYFRVVDCEPMPGTYWAGKQIILVYTKNEYKKNDATLEEVAGGMYSDLKAVWARLAELNAGYSQLESAHADLTQRFDTLSVHAKDLNDRLYTMTENYKAQVELWQDVNDRLYTMTENFKERDRLWQAECENSAKLLDGYRSAAQRAYEISAECSAYSQTKAYKLAATISRIKHQGFSKDKEERKEFRRWLKAKLTGKSYDGDEYANPIVKIQGLSSEIVENFSKE